MLSPQPLILSIPVAEAVRGCQLGALHEHSLSEAFRLLLMKAFMTDITVGGVAPLEILILDRNRISHVSPRDSGSRDRDSVR